MKDDDDSLIDYKSGFGCLLGMIVIIAIIVLVRFYPFVFFLLVP